LFSLSTSSIAGYNSPMKPNKHWTCLDTEPPGLAPGCQRRWLLGPFEEEEEGSCIASDVVIKVEGEDPGTPGSLRSVDTRKNPGTVRFPEIGSTKQSNTSTHTQCVAVWQCCRTQAMKSFFQLINSMFVNQLLENNNLSCVARLEHGKVPNSKLFAEAKTDCENDDSVSEGLPSLNVEEGYPLLTLQYDSEAFVKR